MRVYERLRRRSHPPEVVMDWVSVVGVLGCVVLLAIGLPYAALVIMFWRD